MPLHLYRVVGLWLSLGLQGRLYANVDTTNSVWQIEPRTSRISARERTTSSASTTSTRSSYAFVSDPEISSSFAASLESGQVSDVDDLASPSPGLSSPTLSSADEQRGFPFQRRRVISNNASRPVSPGHALRSMASSYSSLDSLHTTHSGRLLTLHLEKDKSIIWPSLIVGPCPDTLSPYVHNSVIFDASQELEHQYNMDSTSLVLIALELYDIRKDKEEAFECFLYVQSIYGFISRFLPFYRRAWHLSHVPTATMKLVAHYLPLKKTLGVDAHTYRPQEHPLRGTPAYYLQCIGGPTGLAQLYLEAGMLHLDGAASNLKKSFHSSLTSLRVPQQSDVIDGGTEAWKRDREAARRYFDRARTLQPNLDIPTLPPSAEETNSHEELEMPSIDVVTSSPVRRRRKKEETALLDKHEKAYDIDNTWYLYIPGLVGAGTALVVVGVIGALSFSSWSRRNQGS